MNLKNKFLVFLITLVENIISSIGYINKDISWQNCYEYLNKIHKDARSSACFNSSKADSLSYKYDLAVIMTTYNRRNLAERCIESILSQKTKYKVEYIFVNDGSEDDTSELLEKYKSIKNITIINQKNSGLSVARNVGIAASNAKYLTFVDDDDELAPGAIDIFANAATEFGDYEVIEGSRVRISQNGREILEEKPLFGETSNPLKHLHIGACGKLYRRTIFNSIKFPEQYIFEDWINPALIFSSISKAYIIKNVVYKYYKTAGSITQSPYSPNNIDAIYITLQLLTDRKNQHIKDDLNSYDFFLSRIESIYFWTRYLGIQVLYSEYAILKHILKHHYSDFRIMKRGAHKILENTLLNNNFFFYVLYNELIPIYRKLKSLLKINSH